MPVIPALRKLGQEVGEFGGEPSIHSKTLSQKKKLMSITELKITYVVLIIISLDCTAL
jgi:hypothetical protein